MPRFQVEQTATAVILWEGEAASEADALDKMAQDAGYRDYADCCAALGGDDDGVVAREMPEMEDSHGR